MANKRYFWMKLFDTFFQDARIKKLKRMAGGDTYIIIQLKIMLQTINNDGVYIYEGLENTLAEELELKIDEDAKNIQVVLDYMNANNMIEQLEDNMSYSIPKVKEYIGSETASTQRSRKSREVTKKLNVLQCNTTATDCNTEIELEQELDLDINKEKKKL
jgi:predicted phage replisome organizer